MEELQKLIELREELAYMMIEADSRQFHEMNKELEEIEKKIEELQKTLLH